MTRKTYKKKIRNLIIAIAKHPTRNLGCTKVGEALRYAVNDEHLKIIVKVFGSYKAAWNDKNLAWARRFYLGENV